MEQKVAKRSKRAAWSVYVFIEREVQEGRSVKRRKRLTAPIPDRYVFKPLQTTLHKFLYLNVTKMQKKDGLLVVQVGIGKNKEIHTHEVKSVNSVQVREYKRDGRIE